MAGVICCCHRLFGRPQDFKRSRSNRLGRSEQLALDVVAVAADYVPHAVVRWVIHGAAELKQAHLPRPMGWDIRMSDSGRCIHNVRMEPVPERKSEKTNRGVGGIAATGCHSSGIMAIAAVELEWLSG